MSIYELLVFLLSMVLVIGVFPNLFNWAVCCVLIKNAVKPPWSVTEILISVKDVILKWPLHDGTGWIELAEGLLAASFCRGTLLCVFAWVGRRFLVVDLVLFWLCFSFVIYTRKKHVSYKDVFQYFCLSQPCVIPPKNVFCPFLFIYYLTDNHDKWRKRAFFVHISEWVVCFLDGHAALVNIMSLKKKKKDIAKTTNSNSNLHKFLYLFITVNLNPRKSVLAHEGTQGHRWVVSKLLFAVWRKC